MYNIFITPKNGIRQLIAQVSDCRAFLRRRYDNLIPVAADLDHAIWKSRDGTHIEAHSVVEKIFDVPLQEPEKVETKGKPARDPGWYWIKTSNYKIQVCYWDGEDWQISNTIITHSDSDLMYIHPDKLREPKEIFQISEQEFEEQKQFAIHFHRSK